MENSRVMRSMLFDFYGELLTDKQREYFDLHYNEDLSLAEIAEQSGISRQGVWDIIRRAEAAMTEVEEKTGLIKRFNERNAALAEIRSELTELGGMAEGRAQELVRSISEKLDELEEEATLWHLNHYPTSCPLPLRSSGARAD